MLLLPDLACTGDDTGKESQPTEHVTWETAFDTTSTGALSGVWGTTPDDVWIVGGSDNGGETYHYDGNTWSPVAVPEGTGLLVWTFGFATDDIFAVGIEGTILHWDGSTWTTLNSGTTRDLWGVWGTSKTDLWIVGGEISGSWPLILHYDGNNMTEVTLDTEQNLHGGLALFKVWGIGNKVYAVGDLGLIIEWDGTTWNEVFAGQLANDDFVSLWGTSEDHIVAVGGRNNGRIATFDGTTWTTEMPEGVVGLNAVYMTRPDEAVIGGIYGYTATYNPEDTTLTADPLVSQYDIHAVWCDSEKTCWGVGGAFSAPYSGVALKRVAP